MRELVSIDVNYGFGGEASTVTLQENEVKGGCKAEPVEDIFIDEILNNVLDGFLPIRESRSKSGGFKKFTTEYVDASAQRLDAVAVLVRGISASQYGSPEKLNERIFHAAETPLFQRVSPKAKDSNTGVEKMGASAIVIGSVYSVFSASDEIEGKNYDEIFQAGQSIHKVPKGLWPPEIENRFKYGDVSVSMRYGYTTDELKKALESLEYTLQDWPKESSGIILMENSGSLKSCISSMASMYGLYWICFNNTIKFFTPAEILAINIEDPTEQCDNINASFSEDFYGKSKVGVISGSPSGKESSDGGGDGGGSENTRRLPFALIDSVGDFDFSRTSNIVAKFFSFLKFDGDPDLFDWYFWHLWIHEEDLPAPPAGQAKIALRNSQFIRALIGDLYDKVPLSPRKVVADFGKAEAASLFVSNPKAPMFFQLPPDDPERPSQTKIFPVLKSLVELYNSTYISKPVSKYFSENYSVTPDDSLTISTPYVGTTKVIDVSELSEFYVLMEELFAEDKIENYTLYQLAQKIWKKGGRNEDGGEQPDFALEPDKAYFYIGTKDFIQQLKSDGSGDKIEHQRTLIGNLRKPLQFKNYISQTGIRSYMPTSDANRNHVFDADAGSVAFFNEINSSPQKENFRLKCSKIREDASSLEDNSPEQDDAISQLLSSGENKVIAVRVFDGGDLASIDISTFTTTADERITEEDLGVLMGVEFPTKSSSVTTLGYTPPPEVLTNPELSSYSINISGGRLETTIAKSTRDLLAIDQSVLTAGRTSSTSKNNTKLFKSSQKNYLGTH